MAKNDLKYLEEERIKLWEAVVQLRDKVDFQLTEITELKSDVSKKTSDYEKDAKNSASQAARNKTRTASLLKEAQGFHEQITTLLNQIDNFKNSIPEITELYQSVKNKENDLKSILSQITDNSNTILEKQNNISITLENAETSLENAETSKSDIDEVRSEVEELQQKATLAHNQIIKRNSEIREVYNEIFGYDHKNEDTDESEHIDGMKDELEKSYGDLSDRIDELDERLSKLIEQTVEEHKTFIASENKESEELKNKIRSLLPDAMTAGLSHAYENKRGGEEIALNKHYNTFKWAITLLAITALVPIITGVAFIFQGKSLEQVILDTPRIVLCILPLYLPLFWFAIYANKSVNLSKRLIEEYSHKEVLSKTFEGLSKQVDNIKDDSMTNDLRVRLLYNIISASSENPGQLIKNYHGSDNPILNVLDKSISFKESLEKISYIPGVELVLNKVVAKQNKSKELVEGALEESLDANDGSEEIS